MQSSDCRETMLVLSPGYVLIFRDFCRRYQLHRFQASFRQLLGRNMQFSVRLETKPETGQTNHLLVVAGYFHQRPLPRVEALAPSS